jgi:hypothetical protein
LRSYDSVPVPPFSRRQLVSLSQSSFVLLVEIMTGEGRGVGGRGAKSYHRDKSLALDKSFSILSALQEI